MREYDFISETQAHYYDNETNTIHVGGQILSKTEPTYFYTVDEWSKLTKRQVDYLKTKVKLKQLDPITPKKVKPKHTQPFWTKNWR